MANKLVALLLLAIMAFAGFASGELESRSARVRGGGAQMRGAGKNRPRYLASRAPAPRAPHRARALERLPPGSIARLTHQSQLAPSRLAPASGRRALFNTPRRLCRRRPLCHSRQPLHTPTTPTTHQTTPTAAENRKLQSIKVSVGPAPKGAAKAKSAVKLKNYDQGYFGSPFLPFDARFIMGGLAYPNVMFLGRGSG